MAETINISSVEELRQFLNDNKVLEVVTRDKKKKFKKFFNLILDQDSMTRASETANLMNDNNQLMQKVLHAVGQNSSLSQRSIQLLGNVAKLQGVGLVLNGLNLGATCAGFAIMNAKLNKMSAEINGNIAQLQSIMKEQNLVLSERDFNEVIREHSDMLDCRRLEKPYSEKDMRKLVDQEYNVLYTLIACFKRELSSERQTLIIMIFSLLSMFTASLKYFDEIYYVNNHNKLGDSNVYHLSHDSWMGIYDLLSDDQIVEYLQDYAIFEKNMNTRETDIYYKELLSLVIDGREDVEDNLELMHRLKEKKLVDLLRKTVAEETREEMNQIIDEAFSDNENESLRSTFENACNQSVALY